MNSEVHIPTSPKRVKVYELCKDEWTDKGTGYCSGEIINNSDPFIVVRNEDNRNEILLKEYIKGEIHFQKQQETLIVWSLPDKNDMALSFQEPDGCSIVCDFLVFVQKSLAQQISIVVVTSTEEGELSEMIAGPINFPPEPHVGNLADVYEAITHLVVYQFSRESLCAFLIGTDFVKKLVAIFDHAESSHNLSELHNLCRIIKILCMYNIFIFLYLLTN